MYTKITNSMVTIYDANTNEFIGKAKFEFCQKSEEDVLRLVNYNATPSSLVLLNVNLYEHAKNYVPPILYSQSKRIGVFRASFKDAFGGTEQIEINLKYNARARGNLSKNLYYFDSVECTNIEVGSIREI